VLPLRQDISIGTLDNPGWSIEILLRGTALENTRFEARSYGNGENSEPTCEKWLTCKVVGKKFRGFGGPFKLQEMMSIFLDWAGEKANKALRRMRLRRLSELIANQRG
jgi:hypothetical protein